jgi:hypothetical protein
MEDIEEIVRRHDRYQFETKLGYDLTNETGVDRYTVETFLFFPRNLDVNEETYSKRQFYRDLLLYIRFKTPDFTLAELGDPHQERSPLSRLAPKVRRLEAEPTEHHRASLLYEIRLFGCALKSASRDALRALQNGPTTVAEAGPRAAEMARSLARAAAEFRRLEPRLAGLPEARDTFRLTDEYISLLIENRAHQALNQLETLAPGSPGDPFRAAAAGLIRDETRRRRERDYPSLIREDGDNEVFIYRQSVLKKFVAGALHLTMRPVNERRRKEQMALAVGAGVAMLFATTVAFAVQWAYGTLSLTFFGALVVSYMFKDRLKAAAQDYFKRALSKNLFDQASDILDPHADVVIGRCREQVSFADERHVDPQVLRRRARDAMADMDNLGRSESILHYVKEITLRSNILLREGTRKRAVTDIARFHLGRFLSRMDDPEADVPVLGEEDRPGRRSGSRVYHVNMVIKLTSAQGVRYERVRLVLTRQGIKRLELAPIQ